MENEGRYCDARGSRHVALIGEVSNQSIAVFHLSKTVDNYIIYIYHCDLLKKRGTAAGYLGSRGEVVLTNRE